MKIKNHIVNDVCVPSKIIFKNELYQITNLHEKFIIKGYTVKTVNNMIDSVILSNPHPNANPKTGEFCLPYKLRSLKFNKKEKEMIVVMLCHFNLDDCYFTPWNEIEYRRIGG
jgi:hypothetical protein